MAIFPSVTVFRKILLVSAISVSTLWGTLACAQGEMTPVMPRLHAALDFIPAYKLKPVQLVEHTDADDIFSLLVVEFAIQDEKFELAAQAAFDFAKEKNDVPMAKKAMQLYLASSSSQKAADAARLWYKLDPDNEEASATALALAASNGETEGLVNALRLRLQQAKNKEQAIYQTASIVARMNDKKMALEVYEKAVEGLVDDQSTTFMLMADLAYQVKELDKAWQSSLKALELDAASDASAERVLQYGREGHKKEAMEIVGNFIQTNANARRLRLLYISEMVNDKAFDAAILELKEMEKTFPEDFDLLYMEAQVYYQAKKLAQAKKLLKQFLDVQTQRREALSDAETDAQGQSADARIMLAQIYEEEQNYRAAISQLEKIDDPSAQLQIQMQIAVLHGKNGNEAKATALLKSLQPEEEDDAVRIRLTQALIYRNAGKADQAIRYLRQADNDMPRNALIKYELAMMYEQQGSFEEMETLLREVIALKPSSPEAYNALGYVFADRNMHLDEAQLLLDRAVALAPDNPFILDSMGWLQFRLGNLELALEYLENAFELSEQADIAAHLGEVLWVKGEKNRARDIFIKGRELEKQNKTLEDAIKRLGISLRDKK
ncbi:tetratricopeptide repeat protein [Advenella alkanexedens]|uniref:tetratricopeptide repeat protein n=1 Tax=Advenella alkanexedens TaxID=1481665 RepID=UPI002676BE7D|nr:tetratricopeptide repeat protein [Advenella alkanexedens]WKU20262.1 tetratricopeptide repeat protein [Advenella alkanexedens]